MNVIIIPATWRDTDHLAARIRDADPDAAVRVADAAPHPPQGDRTNVWYGVVEGAPDTLRFVHEATGALFHLQRMCGRTGAPVNIDMAPYKLSALRIAGRQDAANIVVDQLVFLNDTIF